MKKKMNEPGTLLMQKGAIRHLQAATTGKRSLFDPITHRLYTIPKTHEKIVHTMKTNSNLYEAYGEAFKKAEAAGWGENYLIRFECHQVILHRPKPADQ